MTQTNEYGVPVVEVELGGKSYRLAFDMGGMRRLMKTEGLGLEAFDKLQEPDQAVDVLDGVVWAALATSAPDVTREEVAARIHFGNFPKLMSAIDELVVASFPEVVPLVRAMETPKAKRPSAKAKGKKPSS